MFKNSIAEMTTKHQVSHFKFIALFNYKVQLPEQLGMTF